MPSLRYTLGDVVAEQQRSNKLLEAILAKVSAVITVKIDGANAPPQFVGPTEVLDGVVGATIGLQGFDPDGDPITWSMDASPLATVSPAGVLKFIAPGTGAITVHLDDGKP